MDTKQFFKDVYEDFFGVEKIKAENEKLAKELGLNQDYPTIELNKQDETKEELTEEKIKETKDEFMLKSFEKLEKLYITEQSKNTLKKIIEYMRKYSEGIEKQYIPFNMCIYSNAILHRWGTECHAGGHILYVKNKIRSFLYV